MAITVQEAQVLFSSDGLKQVQSQAGQAGKYLDRATQSAGRFNRVLGATAVAVGGIRSAMSGVGGMLAVIGAGAAGAAMMKLAGGAEQTAIAFEVMLGSSSKAKDMIDEMRKLDMKSAFSFQDLSEAGRLMMNFGVTASDVIPALSIMGDIAAGDSEKLHSLTLAFSQMSSAGRLMGQDLLQMVNAGFNPLQEISRKTGESMLQLKQRMEAGGISSHEVAMAFQSATQAGGRFYGMNDRMSQTTLGQWNKLKGSVELLAIELGTVLLPEANRIIQWAQEMVAKTDGVKTSFQTLVTSAKTWFRDIGDNVSDMGVVFGTVAGHITSVWSGLWADLKSHAQAFFDWMTTNASVMGENIAIHWRNAQQALRGNFDRTTWEADRQFQPFVAPQSQGRSNGGLWEKIQSELETARRLRQEGRNAENKDGNKPKGVDETKNDAKRGEFGSSGTTESGSGGKSQALSAEALFGSLRQGALDKQIGLMTQGLNLQQQQLAAQNQMVAGLNNLNVGLA